MILKYHTQSTGVNAIGYALFRTAIGMLLLINGWDKWISLPGTFVDFPDPIGIGSKISVYLVIFAELVCGLAIALGLVTRLASLPVIVTFMVAVFMVHINDPFEIKQTAILYLVASLYIAVNGSGRYSIDNLIWPAIPETSKKKIGDISPES